MSGGRFDYSNDYLCDAIFGYAVSPDYGAEGFSQSKKAAKINPFEDRIVSEFVFDTFCLIHSFDWYRSGDTDEETYKKDVKYFKDKWFKKHDCELSKRIVDDAVDDLKKELYEVLGI